MRVMFSASPGVGHIFPMVSLAWALRSAGHEVLLATAGEMAATAKTGIPTVDVSPGLDVAQVFQRSANDVGSLMEDTSRAWTALTREDPDDNERDQAKLVGRMFGAVAEEMIEGTVAAADGWKPDLIVYSAMQGAAEVAAAELGVPAVMHGISPAHALMAGPFREVLHDTMVETYRSRDISIPDMRVRSIDIAPPCLGEPTPHAWPMRAVPFNGGGVIPHWLLNEPDRPCVAVTLGTVLPAFSGLESLSRIFDAARQIDADFLLAIGQNVDTAALGNLPDNVHPCGWISFGTLTQRCSAAIHHGGSGTMFAAMDSGVPQLVLPQGADQFVNASIAHEAGIGMRADPNEVDSVLIKGLLSDDVMRSGAVSTAREMRSMPSPVDVAADLVKFVWQS